jgi:phage terminase large subunit-like protein
MPAGRPRDDEKALKLRAAPTLRKSHRKKSKPKTYLRIVKPRWQAPPIPRTAAQWRRLICSLPGYDPYATKTKCRFDSKLARKAISFFHDRLRHVKGEKAGTPFYLERWQQAFIGNLFGWKIQVARDGDGNLEWRRRYREALLFVPRKNGKTPLAAGIVLYMLSEDGEPCAEIYGAASEYKQASLVFEHARGMVLQDPGAKGSAPLSKRCKIYSGQSKAIQLISDYSTYRVISSDAYSAHGYNTHAAVIDELHTHPTRDLVDTLTTSTGARRQPLIVHLTTSDFERPGSICNEKHDYAGKVRDGIIDDSAFLPVIFEASKDADWTSPKTWAKANPNLGVSVSLEYLERECQRAQEIPACENTFKRLHLNIRTEQDVRCINMEVWDECGEREFDPKDLLKKPCWAGLDLATTTDTTALVLLFKADDGGFFILPFFWVPRETARERSRRDRIPYMDWIREGLIRTTEGNVTDYAVVRRDINDLGDQYGIREIAIDRNFQGAQLMIELGQDGFDVVPFGQGFHSMPAPTKAFLDAIVARKLYHNKNPVLRWMASNLAVEMNAPGDIKPSRKKSTEKIDGIVSCIMALGRAVAGIEKTAHYNQNDLFVI